MSGRSQKILTVNLVDRKRKWGRKKKEEKGKGQREKGKGQGAIKTNGTLEVMEGHKIENCSWASGFFCLVSISVKLEKLEVRMHLSSCPIMLLSLLVVSKFSTWVSICHLISHHPSLITPLLLFFFGELW